MPSQNTVTDIRNYWGGLIVLIGLVFLLEQIGIGIHVGEIWPVFILAPGLMFWYIYGTKRSGDNSREALIIPGTILTLLGLFFVFESATQWRFSDRTAFCYPLIVSLAFFAAYRFGQRARGYLVPAWMLAGATLIVFFSATARFNAWPLLLIVIGGWLMFRQRSRSPKE